MPEARASARQWFALFSRSAEQVRLYCTRRKSSSVPQVIRVNDDLEGIDPFSFFSLLYF